MSESANKIKKGVTTMKKVLAVLLAVIMLFSVVAIGVAAETTTAAAGEEGSNVQLPEWLTVLISRLKQVIAKLLLKLGIKLNWNNLLAA